MKQSASSIVVLGLGNPVLTDDAAGLEVIAELERLLAAEPLAGINLESSTRAGFELLDLLHGYRHAILVDCIDVPDAIPGRIRELSLADFTGSARLVNAHELSVAAAFALAERLGLAMPEVVEIYAIEAADVSTLSEALTPEVAVAVQSLARQLQAKLRLLTDGEGPGADAKPQRRSFYDPRQ